MGITLQPNEFQRIYLKKTNKDPDDYDLGIDPNREVPDRIKGILDKFEPFDGDVSLKIIKVASPMLEHRSGYKKYLYPRLIKMASDKRKPKRQQPRLNAAQKATPGILAGSYLYSKYLDNIPGESAQGLDKTIKDKPWVLPLATVGSIGAMKGMQAKKDASKEWEKTAANLGGRIFAGIPAAYLASNLASRLDSESKVIKFLEEHPNIVALLGIGATNTTEDWRAIREAILDLQDEIQPMLTKTAAEMMSPNEPDLISDIEKLYNRYNKIDKKYDRANKIGNLFLGYRDPISTLGRGADMLAMNALNKTLSKT